LFVGAPEIARRFGVGRDTIYRHLKKVGAVEGRLLPELLAPLNAAIDAKQRAERIARWVNQGRRIEQASKITDAVSRFMEGFVLADRAGRLAKYVNQFQRPQFCRSRAPIC